VLRFFLINTLSRLINFHAADVCGWNRKIRRTCSGTYMDNYYNISERFNWPEWGWVLKSYYYSQGWNVGSPLNTQRKIITVIVNIIISLRIGTYNLYTLYKRVAYNIWAQHYFIRKSYTAIEGYGSNCFGHFSNTREWNHINTHIKLFIEFLVYFLLRAPHYWKVTFHEWLNW